MAQVRDENTFKFVDHKTACHLKCHYVHFMPGSTDRREGVDMLHKCCGFFGKRTQAVCHTGGCMSSEVCPTTGRDAAVVLLSSQVIFPFYSSLC